LYAFLDKIFNPNGFIRKKDTYYLQAEECICFFSIGKSQFGGRYDHVMGCFLRELHPKEGDFPKFYKSDLKFSLRELSNKDKVKKIFDFENQDFSGSQRELIIEDLIINKAIPFLKDVSSIQGIKNSVKKYKDLRYSITGELMDALGIPYPKPKE